ncbi:hypothetical protein RM160_21565 (plasmid) [Pantoea agglomerans]|uniref:alpha/beta fold hydrolase n=1 Tax=Enterobacter agglomerans TaxID=549 RepID=UPI0028A1A161|nr:hypothetical protein [Pantoea agglomerans]WNK42348.1 hypothetical protein RM160_21565 [Pantoea agglomerans]WNK51305.1 hypothetical protein RM153_21715 [Pantoea agglomerans]
MEFEHITFDLPHGIFHALQGGDPDGQPTIFLHGFPDHPPTAKAFLAELGRRGRYVIAPWLRGYAPSPTAGPFDFSAERIERAVTLAIPHPLTFMGRMTSPAQLRRSWYMGLFQLPGSGWLATTRDLVLIDHLWRQWSPGFSLEPALRKELHEHLWASMPAPLKFYRAMLRPGMFDATRERLSRLRCPCCSFTEQTTAASSPQRSTTSIGLPPSAKTRSFLTWATFCTLRHPRQLRNESRHGPD